MPREEILAVDAALADGGTVERSQLAAAVRTVVAHMASNHPGRLIELRIPPFAAAQLGDGTGGVHTRGTPPNVVEMDAATLLGLASGRLDWDGARTGGNLRASGTRSDISGWFPVLADGAASG
jgi:hypothetical protein